MDAESFLILVYSTGHSEWNLALLIITAMQQGGYPYYHYGEKWEPGTLSYRLHNDWITVGWKAAEGEMIKYLAWQSSQQY